MVTGTIEKEPCPSCDCGNCYITSVCELCGKRSCVACMSEHDYDTRGDCGILKFPFRYTAE